MRELRRVGARNPLLLASKLHGVTAIGEESRTEYVNRHESEKLDALIAQWKSVSSSLRRTLDTLWKADLVNKFHSQENPRHHRWELSDKGRMVLDQYIEAGKAEPVEVIPMLAELERRNAV